MQVTTIGIDLAKHVFQDHGITKDGEVVFNRAIRRAQLIQFFTNLEPSLIGMEVCGSPVRKHMRGRGLRLIANTHLCEHISQQEWHSHEHIECDEPYVCCRSDQIQESQRRRVDANNCIPPRPNECNCSHVTLSFHGILETPNSVCKAN